MLGFENLDGYLAGHPYFGAIVGRVANRIRNAEFTLEGTRYTLAANDKPHHLHGGTKGWDKVVWTAKTADTADGPSIELTYVSKDGEEGYPGTVTARTVYTLTHNNELKVEMQATHRQDHARQHGPPQLLESRRTRLGDHPRSRADALCGSLHAGDPDGPGWPHAGRHRDAVRLHHRQTHRPRLERGRRQLRPDTTTTSW